MGKYTLSINKVYFYSPHPVQFIYSYLKNFYIYLKRVSLTSTSASSLDFLLFKTKKEAKQ
jgi:hypothetical protein